MEQTGVGDDDIQISSSVCQEFFYCGLCILYRIAGNVFILQPERHIEPAGAGGYDCFRAGVFQMIEIYIPEPGDVFAILPCVINLDEDVFGAAVF